MAEGPRRRSWHRRPCRGGSPQTSGHERALGHGRAPMQAAFARRRRDPWFIRHGGRDAPSFCPFIRVRRKAVTEPSMNRIRGPRHWSCWRCRCCSGCRRSSRSGSCPSCSDSENAPTSCSTIRMRPGKPAWPVFPEIRYRRAPAGPTGPPRPPWRSSPQSASCQRP